MRKRLVTIILAPLSVALIWNLRLGGATYVTAFIVALFIVAAGICQISASILISVPRLRGEISRLQFIDGINAFMRLALTAMAAAIYLDLFVAVAISLWGSLFQFWIVRKTASHHVDLHAPVDPEFVAKTRTLINRQWLNELNGVFQGQISIVLLSLFGTVAAVADFGALGRLAIIFAAFGGTLQSVILPRYARCDDPIRLRALYVQTMLLLLIITITPFVIALLFPDPFLWLLGAKYDGLQLELALAMLGTGLGALNTFSWLLNTARAWIIPGVILVPVSLLIQALLILLIGVSTLRQVLLFGILTNLMLLIINLAATLIFSRGFSRR